ncbi:rab-GTPase-TBC domain-containing protein [Artemisia annua]|uniref:Rab-GTPase-TBC domain-containing protein n=1 Tax=Artemisia annua TaxID=35608 RepID=A0A2U1NFD5_ARTAN|nr:rab-GTPase-TBC domain-containing protein [Artemisia annua]
MDMLVDRCSFRIKLALKGTQRRNVIVSGRDSVSPGEEHLAGQNLADGLKQSEGGDGSEITCKSESESSDSEFQTLLKKPIGDKCVLSNGCRKSSDDSNNYYWEYTPDGMVFSCGCKAEIWVTKGLLDKAKGNILGMKIIRDQSGNTLRGSQSRVHNGKLRIIRLDAIRANDEWIVYTPSQAAVSLSEANKLAESVCLKDYNHLEPCRIYHAARLISILEAYALHDSEIGYCQGMSDLLSPIISVMVDDSEAFWCFVGFMKKARHNFRLDEVGIRRQLNKVSKIIKGKDSQFYKHLVELQAEDCFFLYRMVVVLFRRELNFEQTLCLWEVMWADQTAIRAGITKLGLPYVNKFH